MLPVTLWDMNILEEPWGSVSTHSSPHRGSASCLGLYPPQLVTVICTWVLLPSSSGSPSASLPSHQGSFLYSTLTRQVPRTSEFGGRGAEVISGQSISPTPRISCRERHILIRTDAGQKTQGQDPSAAFAVEVPFQTMWQITYWPHGLFWKEMPGALRDPQTAGREDASDSPGARALSSTSCPGPELDGETHALLWGLRHTPQMVKKHLCSHTFLLACFVLFLLNTTYFQRNAQS